MRTPGYVGGDLGVLPVALEGDTVFKLRETFDTFPTKRVEISGPLAIR